jgi:hypothetical protein
MGLTALVWRSDDGRFVYVAVFPGERLDPFLREHAPAPA